MNLRLMLQVAGCQVCCVSNLAEGLNIAHTARETGEMVVCFVGRTQQLSVEEVERFLAYVEENGLSLPLVC